MVEIDVRRILRGVARRALRLCHVMFPARVVDYDRDLRRVSVQPQVRERFADGQSQDRPVVASRPVVLPRGGGFGIWFDLRKNDPCVTLVADETTAGYFETGQPVAPAFGQRHQPSDAVIFPGGVPDPEQKPVNAEGEMVAGMEDLTANIIFRQATIDAPGQAGTAEIRVSVRLDLGGAAGLPVARSTDKVAPDGNFKFIMGKIVTAVNTVVPGSITPEQVVLFEQAMGAIVDRPDAKVWSE